MRVPPQSVHWAHFWPGADIDAMAADVEARLAAALDAWALRDVEVLEGGNVSVVVATDDVVVKVSPRGHPDEAELAGEADVLERWRATGAVVEVRDVRDHGLTLLLERLRPGTTLHEAALPWEQKLTIVGGLVRRLHASGDGLLHYDLHVRNVLLGGDGWKAIDPKGIAGDPHDEVWALLSPEAPPDPDEATFRRWAEVYAEASGLEVDGVLAGVERRRSTK